MAILISLRTEHNTTSKKTDDFCIAAILTIETSKQIAHFAHNIVQ